MPSPEAARVAFGDRLPLAEAYARWLAGAGVERGLLGPREADRVWERHLLNCAVIAGRLPEGAKVADIGSGAGLPGIVLALARPDLEVTLVEPLLRRAAFLEEVRADLGLEVQVLRARADEVTERFDVVVSRALAPLDRLARWCAPLLVPDGLLLAIKGKSAEVEVAQHRLALESLGLRDVAVSGLVDGGGSTTYVVSARRSAGANATRVAGRVARTAVAQ